MASNANEIIGLDLLKQQLRLRAGDTSRDGYLTTIRDGAIAAVETYTGRTLIDKDVVESFIPPGPGQPHRVRRDGVVIDSTDATAKSAEIDVEYIDVNGQLATERCLLVGDDYMGTKSALIYPPEPRGDWVCTGDGRGESVGRFRTNLSLVGPAAADVLPQMVSAALILCTAIFHGTGGEEISKNNAVAMLLKDLVIVRG